MNRLLKSSVLLLAAGALASASAADPAPSTAAGAPKPASLFSDAVIAKGKGVEVKRGQLDEEVIRIKSQYAAHGQSIPADQSTRMEQQLLDQLIQIQLLRSQATDADKAAGKAQAQKNLDEAKAQLGSEDAVNRQLQAMNITREELLAKWTDAGTAESVLKRELKVNVTDADVKKYYDEHSASFEQAEMVRASHILLRTSDDKGNDLSTEEKEARHKKMEDILKRARGGEDFAKLAREYSEDPGSKNKGGEYTFPRGKMMPEFEVAAFALKTNEISDIVTTKYGYHIIKLSEKIPAHKITLAKAADDIKKGLTQQEMRKQFPDYYKKLRDAAKIEILDEKLKPKDDADTMGLPAGHPAVKTH